MEEKNGFMDDMSRLANEAGSTLRRAGGKALDKFETWRLEQDLTALYAELGSVSFAKYCPDGDISSIKSINLSEDPDTVNIMKKIASLKDEIAVRKATVSVSEKL